MRLGMAIQRCQDLPPEAFGDVEKAAVLLVISHRWLDRFNCDVPSAGCPHGLRLTTMTRRLDQNFPERLCAGLWRQTFDSMRYGGNDVLVFFDFMALPQIGKDPKTGRLIQRTESEADLFFKALPDMGALYTMYPVLVLKEVPPGVAPYDSSGWCFAEFCSALLTKQLSKYSAEALEEYVSSDSFSCIVLAMAAGTIDEHMEQRFIDAFDVDLSKRRFFDEQDRQIVRGLIIGNLLIRQLRDAVEQGADDAGNLAWACHGKEFAASFVPRGRFLAGYVAACCRPSRQQEHREATPRCWRIARVAELPRRPAGSMLDPATLQPGSRVVPPCARVSLAGLRCNLIRVSCYRTMKG